MSNYEITTAENLLKLARKVQSDGSFDLEEMLEASFSKDTILNWLKETGENKALAEHDRFLSELLNNYSDSLSDNVSEQILNEREKLFRRMQEISFGLDHFAIIKKELLQNAKVMAIKKSASDIGAINPDIINELLKDKTISFVSQKGKVVVRMKEKTSLLDGIIAMKNCRYHKHLFR